MPSDPNNPKSANRKSTHPRSATGASPAADEFLETNLRALFQHAYHPPQPRQGFHADLRRQLHAQAQRRARHARSLSVGTWATAAALLLSVVVLASFLTSSMTSTNVEFELHPNSGICEFRAEPDTPWVSLTVPQIRAAGDIRTDGNGRVYLQPATAESRLRTTPAAGARNKSLSPGNESPELFLATHSLFSLPRQLQGGSCRWHVPSGSKQILETPVARIHAQGCEVGIWVHDANSSPITTLPTTTTAHRDRDDLPRKFPAELSTSDRRSWKGDPMNSKLIAGVATGALLVTLIVYNMSDDGAVEVETRGQRTPVSDGASVTFDQKGAVSADREGLSSNKKNTNSEKSDSATSDDVSSETFLMKTIHGQVRDLHGDPIAGANVLFRNSDSGVETIVARTSSDDAGAFQLSVQEGSTGAVVANKDRFVESSYDWPPLIAGETEDGASDSSDPRAPQPDDPDDPRAAAAASGESTDAEIPELVLTLDRETAITGSIAFATREEAPPEKFLVTIERYYDAYRRDQPIMREFSNEDRSFYFAVAPGQYRVWAYARGYSRPAEIRVAPAAHEVAEAHFDLKLGTSVSGRVITREGGRPVADAVVFMPLEHLPGSVNRMQRDNVDERVANASRTSSNGEFFLRDLSPGKHILRVLHPEFSPADVRIELVPGDTPDLEVELAKGSAIRGTVLDNRGSAIPGSIVLAFTMVMNQEMGNPNLSLCKEDGSYEIRQLNPGPYILVMVEDPSLEAQSDTKIEMVQVYAGKDTVKDFVAIPQDAVLRGVIRDAEGQLASGVQITLTRATPNPSDFTFKSGMTDSTGAFEIMNLAPGRYMVGLSKNAGGNFTIVDEIDLTQAIDYDQDFEMMNLVVNGVLLASETREPIENGEVLIFRLGQNEQTGETDRTFYGRSVTVGDGKFSFDSLGDGEYALLASADGYRHVWSESFQLDEKIYPKKTLDLIAQPGGRVEVYVRDAEDKVVSGINVKVLDSQKRFINQGLPPRTDGAGFYTFSRLSEGSYTIEVQRGTGPKVEKAFELVDLNQPVRVEIQLPAEGEQD